MESSQIYTYSIKRIKRDVIIKVAYESGYVYDNIDINNLAQTYYELDYTDYNQLKDIVNIWKELSANSITSIREKDALIETVVKGIENLFKKYYSELHELTNVSMLIINILRNTEYLRS